MISDRTLAIAVERSIITVAQRDGLQAIEQDVVLVAAPPVAVEPVDDEALRFVTGFADIFVTIGIALFTGALYFITSSEIGLTTALFSVTLATWLLAEFFTRRRRMALPSIALLLLFVAGAFAACQSLLDSLSPAAPNVMGDYFGLFATSSSLTVGLAGLASAALAAVHYYRFRVPITIAAGVAALCIMLIGIIFSVSLEPSLFVFNSVVLTAGLLTFALAMRFDLSDPARATRRTDIAFWLHLLAAPMIVHTLIRGVLRLDTLLTTTGALGVLGVFVLLGIIAVIIDRRAILVSGLVYAGIAFSTLIKTLGFEGSSLLFPVVLLILGALILLLSAGWHPLRHFLLRLLPVAVSARLPHPLVKTTS